jgi:hypothetical protein
MLCISDDFRFDAISSMSHMGVEVAPQIPMRDSVSNQSRFTSSHDETKNELGFISLQTL